MKERKATQAAFLLGRVYMILEEEGRWVKEAAAMDKKGSHVSPESKEACKWCLSGAIEKAKFDIWPYLNWDTHGVAEDFLAEAVQDKYPSCYMYPDDYWNPEAGIVIKFNDREDTSHEDLMEVIEAAIGEAKRKGGETYPGPVPVNLLPFKGDKSIPGGWDKSKGVV